MIGRFSNILMLLAVFALAFAGGNWTHADAYDHHHVFVVEGVVADHFHSDKDGETTENVIHCGSENFLCSTHYTSGQNTNSSVSIAISPKDWRLQLSEDPPPPRRVFS